MSDGIPGDADKDDFSREAFMAAIVKLADDEAFRRSFLEHYQLWLHPPIIATPDMADIAWNKQPGGVTFITDEQMAGVLRNLKESP